MNKKLIGLIVASTALLTSCNSKEIKVNPNKEKYIVGICQLVQHPALDQATNGFKDKLTELLTKEGREVEIQEKVAAGNASDCATIINGFVASEVDLIMANATAALQAAFTATETIPILGTSITEYGVATGLKFENGKSGTNVSGTSDLASIEQQVDLMLSLFDGSSKPSNKIGILYCSSEANSKFQVDEATKFFQQKGKNVTPYSFTETADLAVICASVAKDCDAVYIPTDNIVAENTETVRANITDKGIPVFAGEAGICKGCGFATLSIDYYRLGEVTGEMAFNILLGKKDIRECEIQYDRSPTKMKNSTIADSLGITIPSDFVEIE